MPLQSQVIPICVPQKRCFFGTFLEKILFLTHFDQINPPMIYINGKLCILDFCTHPNNRVFLNQQAVRILLTTIDRSESLYWDCVVFKTYPNYPTPPHPPVRATLQTFIAFIYISNANLIFGKFFNKVGIQLTPSLVGTKSQAFPINYFWGLPWLQWSEAHNIYYNVLDGEGEPYPPIPPDPPAMPEFKRFFL